jgi:hypothetical protein
MLFSASAPIGNGRNAGTIANNHFGNGLTLRLTEVAIGISFSTNTMEVLNCNLGNLTASISNKRCVSGFSNFEATLYCGLGANSYWKNFILTIDTKYVNENNWVGIFTLRDVPDKVSFIVDLPTNHPCTFYCDPLSSPYAFIGFLIVGLASASNDCILGASNQFPIALPQVYQVKNKTTNQGADFMVIQKQGTINQAINYTSIL